MEELHEGMEGLLELPKGTCCSGAKEVDFCTIPSILLEKSHEGMYP
jgi:hypothetical protein